MSEQNIWIVIVGLALGSFLLRFSFMGFVGNRAMPDWLLRHLRYSAVAILPALVAPQVLWPAATQGETDPSRLAAACVTLAVGYVTKNVLGAILSGGLTLYGLLYLMG